MSSSRPVSAPPGYKALFITTVYCDTAYCFPSEGCSVELTLKGVAVQAIWLLHGPRQGTRRSQGWCTAGALPRLQVLRAAAGALLQLQRAGAAAGAAHAAPGCTRRVALRLQYKRWLSQWPKEQLQRRS